VGSVMPLRRSMAGALWNKKSFRPEKDESKAASFNHLINIPAYAFL